jgi:Family of unknown function (DUF6263)
MRKKLNLCKREILQSIKNSYCRVQLNHWHLIIFIFLIPSCKNMSSHNLSNEKGILFNPEVGVTYKYEIDESKEIEQAIGGNENKVKLTVNSKIGLVYKIMKKIHDNYEVLVQFENCIMDSHSEEDTERDLALRQKNIAAFKGATFTFNLTPDGRVENIKGFKEFKENFVLLNATNTKSNSVFNHIPDTSFEEGYFKDIFEKISTVLPSKTIFINSTWLHNESVEIGESQRLSVQHTLDSISTGTAYIKTTSPVEQTITALNHGIKMQGNKDGVIEIDAETGMLIKSFQKSTITGSLKIGEVGVGMNINRSCMIKGKKL